MYVTDWQEQAEIFNDFSLNSYAWNFIEKPALNAVAAKLLRPSVKILDVGCGSGRIVSWLIEQGTQAQAITGLDVSPNMLRIAQSKHSHSKLLFADITRPISAELGDGYELAFAIHVFQHLDPTEYKQALQNIWRSLAPGGHLIYIVGHPKRDLLTASPYVQPKTWRMRISPWGAWVHHFYRSTVDEYLQPTRDADFSIRSIQTLEPVEAGHVNISLFKEHTKLPSRLLVHAVKVRAFS